MRVDKKTKDEVLNIYDIWIHSYLNGDVETYNSYLDKSFHFIGSTANEEFLNKKDTSDFFRATSEQLAGKSQLRNEIKITEKFDDVIFITHLFDAWFLSGEDWSYYSRFRFTNALQKKKEGWRFIYQHYSTPDSKAQEGETIGYDKISAENLQLREAIQRRTKELEFKNRALEIEGALQRIRAEAVAMKESSDLLDIVVTMRREFTKLGHEAHYFWHMMWLEDKYEKAMTSGDGTKIGFVMELPRHIHGDIPLLANWEKSDEALVIYTMDTTAAIAYVDKMITLGDFQNIDPQAPSHDDIRHIGGLTFIMARTSHGEIGFSLPGVVKNPPIEDLELLKQFASAFDLAHRRFLDLKKAEKQAREVQIELALEKVRSRTMAMQHSDELAEASFLLDAQIRGLGIKTWGCAFNIYGEKESTEWFGNEAGVLHTYTVPRKGIFEEYYLKGQKGESLFIKEFSGEECIAHYEYMSTLPVIGDVLKTLKERNNGFPVYQIDHVAFFKYGYLLFITREQVPDAHEIFKRFANVFQQTYTRFLDLQKAEAQAHESQIELALERIRAQTIAMQKSEELTKIGSLLYQELSKLGIQNLATGYTLFDETATIGWNYGINPIDGSIRNKPVGMKHTKNKVMKAIASSWKKQDPLLVIQLNEKETIKHQTFIAEESINFPISKEKLLSISPKRLVVHTFNFKQGYLLIVGGKLLTVEQQEMITRFANVFQQTYTRFLDLKKAEAQTRESQIELALERVRARTMAMQKSEELKDVIQTVYEQFVALNINIEHSGFIIDYKKNDVMHIWLADKNAIQNEIKLPYFDSQHWNSLREAKKKGENFFANYLPFKEKNKFYKEVFKHIPNLPEDVKQFYFDRPALTISTVLLDNVGLYIENFDSTPYSEEENEILMRFGKVFQQTYTRFLDLQRAEAQTREAQIETALEKVRSRSMAMQQSYEIGEVAKVLYEQLTSLGGALWGTGFVFCEKKSDVDEFWFVNDKGVMPHLTIPHTKDPVHKAMYEGWKDNLEILSIVGKDKDLEKHYKYMLTIPDVQPIFRGMLDSGITFPTWQKWHAAYFKHGYLLVITTEPYEDEEIFKRFAIVFEQSYIRFLDLQKAEAQAKEAQIEVALERVRSRTMAMHQSDELREAGGVLYQELTKLKITSLTIGYVLMDTSEKIGWNYTANPVDGTIWEIAVGIPHDETDIMRSITRSWKAQQPFSMIQLDAEQTIAHQTFIAERGINFPYSVAELISFSPEKITLYSFNFKQGYLLIVGDKKLQPDQEDMMVRFTNVFQQTYTRFLDLKKAEAQTREAKIEASLEKIRTVALSLRKSNEMLDIAKVLYEQLQILGFNDIRNALIDINDEKTETFMDYDYSELMGGTITKMAYDDDPTLKEQLQDIAKTTDGYSEMILEGKQLQDLIDMRKKNGEADDPRLNSATSVSYILYAFGNGAIGISNFGKLNENQKEILDRFRNVFTFAYNRYNELAKAEAQMREVQLEASLEKVRSVALTMQKPEDMLDIAKVLFEQLRELGFKDIRNAIIDVHNEDNETFWDYDYSEAMSGSITLLSYKNDPTLEEQYRKIVSTTNGFYEEIIKGQDLKEYVEMRIRNGEKDDPRLREVDLLSYYLYSFGNGVIGISNFDILNEDQKTILGRFRNVFTFAYKRYKDLVYSQAQAREVQIEAALEKVRSSSLAMQKPDELRDVVTVVAEKLQELGIILDAGGVIICTYFKDSKDVMHWISSPDFSHSQNYLLPYFDHPIFSEAWESKNSGDLYFSKSYPPDIKNSFFEYAFSKTDYKNFPDAIKEIVFKNEQHALSFAWQKNSAILIPSHTGVLPSESDAEIMKRFAKVFEQAYIRFMDLQKAEERARENQIDIALERVRNRTLAMQSSDELSETAVVVFKQLIDLGIAPNRLYIGIIKENKRLIEMWATDEDGTKIGSKIIFNPDRNKSIEKIFNAWKDEKKSINLVMQGKELSTYLKYLNEELGVTVTKGLTQKKRFQTIGFFSKGFIGIAAPEEQPKETTKILERFASVFNLTYTRFSDLKIAEAQTREAKIETALERVRARALAMQQPEELKEVANVLRTEMGQLGLEELETCSIYIYDEKANKTECWYALKDVRDSGKKLVSDYFKLNLKETWVGTQMLKFYNSSTQQTSIKMTGKNRIDWIRYCEANSVPFQGYYGEEIPDRTYHLYKFSHGAIGAAAPQEISEENWELLKRAASVFSLAYSRFKDLTQSREDLQQLKSAKQRAEEALAELQQTQKQLIQSEKMASLGELTAGIAHEIQNPLNFVNNFSEVSNELIDEMNEEIDKGDLKEAKLLANDIKQNLEKINHHGKRADAIVKGMLQHSRKSTAEKEATDINKLADEYLRLAYHGLRAKDKNFNATLDTEFDPTIGLVKLIPQDMGRVILNLITNAFYACNEKSKAIENKNCKPLVTVSTKKMKDEVLVSVEDNGNGIPKKVLDKIFQPFFTTKPTGEGTGLGLSMSYDIIKAHNGELKVNTTEGKGTKFTIHIPTNI